MSWPGHLHPVPSLAAVASFVGACGILRVLMLRAAALPGRLTHPIITRAAFPSETADIQAVWKHMRRGSPVPSVAAVASFVATCVTLFCWPFCCVALRSADWASHPYSGLWELLGGCWKTDSHRCNGVGLLWLEGWLEVHGPACAGLPLTPNVPLRNGGSPIPVQSPQSHVLHRSTPQGVQQLVHPEVEGGPSNGLVTKLQESK